MAILLTTVLVYFITIQNNEKTKSSYEIKAAQASQDKQAEKYAVLRDTGLSGNNLSVSINNEGSLPMVVSKVLLYCISAGCTSPEPVEIPPSLTLNAGESTTRLAGPVSDALTYRVDVISERGNIVSALECTVDATAHVCKNDSNGGGPPDFSLAASPSALITETGKSGTSTITVTSLNGFNSAVTLNISPTITGVSASFSSTQVTPPSGGSVPSTLTVAVSSSATPGTYAMTITGTSGAITHTQTISLTILNISGSVNQGIIQGTGSVQLDYNAFGAIYPGFGMRDGVPQKGWQILTPSTAGTAHGYPGFDIMSGAPVIFVEKFRNFDQSGNDLTLARSTSLLTNIGKEPSGQPDIEYICKENLSTNPPSMLPYDEVTNSKILPATSLNAGLQTGWQEVYFCSKTPGAANNDYIPRNTFNIFHPLFMVIRGTFANSLADYGQTIPYQSTLGGQTDYTSFNACLRDYNTLPNGPSTACASPTADDTTSSLNYNALRSTMSGAGVTAWVHVNSATASSTKITVSWIYPDGKATVLANAVTVNAAKNVQISLPKVNSDGSPISCSGGIGTSQYYAIKVNDGFDSGGQRNVYYMTFRMDC